MYLILVFVLGPGSTIFAPYKEIINPVNFIVYIMVVIYLYEVMFFVSCGHTRVRANRHGRRLFVERTEAKLYSVGC